MYYLRINAPKAHYKESDPRLHARAIPEMLRKIQQVYGLSDAQIQMPETMQAAIYQGIDAEIKNTRWPANLPAQETASLPDAARGLMQRYADAFYLRELVKKVALRLPKPENTHRAYYYQEFARTEFIEAYMGHITNDSQIALETLIGDQDAALRLHKHLIGRAISQCKSNGLKESAWVRPECMGVVIPSTCVENMQSYGKKMGDRLKRDFWVNNGDGSLAASVREAREQAKNEGKSRS